MAVLPKPEVHTWELIPTEVLEMLGISSLKTDRNENPIQILTPKCRLGIFADQEITKKDLLFCSGETVTPELGRGLSFYAKGSDYPVVFGESSTELLKMAHEMEYFEKPAGEVEAKALAHLKKLGITVLESDKNLPEAEQTITLDLSRAKIFRSKFEFSLPMKQLPVGASNRMLFVERNSPVIEMLHLEEMLRVRTLLPEEPLLIEKMMKAIGPYFQNEELKSSQVNVTPEALSQHEWVESKSHVDSSKLGLWLVSPAINPELGERSLYVRISELLAKKFKKEQVFKPTELFHH